jgi:hypothetical protein
MRRGSRVYNYTSTRTGVPQPGYPTDRPICSGLLMLAVLAHASPATRNLNLIGKLEYVHRGLFQFRGEAGGDVLFVLH